MWILSPSVYPSVCAPVSSTKTFVGFSRSTAVLYKKTVQQSRPHLPPAPSELPTVQQHDVAQCLRAPQTCTISATTIVLVLNGDIILKCYPRAAVTVTARQGRMKEGSSVRAIIAIWRSVAASRAATGCRDAMRRARQNSCSASSGSADTFVMN